MTESNVFTILREGNGANGSTVSWKVGNILALLQIPDLDDRVLGAGAKYEAIGMKLGTGCSCRSNGELVSSADITKQPCLPPTG